MNPHREDNARTLAGLSATSGRADYGVQDSSSASGSIARRADGASVRGVEDHRHAGDDGGHRPPVRREPRRQHRCRPRALDLAVPSCSTRMSAAAVTAWNRSTRPCRRSPRRCRHVRRRDAVGQRVAADAPSGRGRRDARPRMATHDQAVRRRLHERRRARRSRAPPWPAASLNTAAVAEQELAAERHRTAGRHARDERARRGRCASPARRRAGTARTGPPACAAAPPVGSCGSSIGPPGACPREHVDAAHDRRVRRLLDRELERVAPARQPQRAAAGRRHVGVGAGREVGARPAAGGQAAGDAAGERAGLDSSGSRSRRSPSEPIAAARVGRGGRRRRRSTSPPAPRPAAAGVDQRGDRDAGDGQHHRDRREVPGVHRLRTVCRKPRTSSLNPAGSSWNGWCACSGTSTRRAPGMRTAIAREWRGGHSTSSSPTTTSVGAVDRGQPVGRVVVQDGARRALERLGLLRDAGSRAPRPRTRRCGRPRAPRPSRRGRGTSTARTRASSAVPAVYASALDDLLEEAVRRAPGVDEHQRPHQVGPRQRQLLRDRAAHREAHHVRAG